MESIQILWSPRGANMPSLGTHALVDVSDGDTPNIRMPVRMLSVDTPEVTARTPARAAAIDREFLELATWIQEDRAPIEKPLREFLLSKLETGGAGTLQFRQGQDASAFAKQNVAARLLKPNGTNRTLFVRIADSPFDNNHRLLAYVAPNYSAQELRDLPREKRATFNLDLVTNGWAAPFVIYPAIPGEQDLPLLVRAAATSRAARLGIWADDNTLLPYEYRAMEKLYRITKKLVNNQPIGRTEMYSWRERYCVDVRTRTLYGPEDYFGIDPEYRLWIWPQDIREAVGRLNLVPARELVDVR